MTSMTSRILFSIVFVFLCRSIFAQQQYTISGSVSDSTSNESLIGAIVSVKGTNKGTPSNEYGFFSLTLAEGETYTLRAVDHDMNLSIWAVTNMQTPAQMDTVYPHINRTAADTIVYFKYKMTDNVNTVDFYAMNFVKKVQGDSTFDINSVFAAGSNEVLTEFELYDDQAFENGVLDRDIAILSAGQTDTVAVSVSKITQGYYEFPTALKRSSSIFNQLTGEPITYPSNVDGGHGYFTMHRTENFIFDLNLY